MKPQTNKTLRFRQCGVNHVGFTPAVYPDVVHRGICPENPPSSPFVKGGKRGIWNCCLNNNIKAIIFKFLLPVVASVAYIASCAYVASFAAVPSKLNYQGMLKANNLPVTGTKSMVVRITNSDGSSEYWNSGTLNVQVSTGVFSVLLDVPAINWGGITPYFELNIGTNTLLPREPLASSVYSLWASTAEAVVDGSITNAKLAGGAYSAITAIGTLTANLDFGGFKAVNAGLPTAPNDLATKGYVDGATGGIGAAILTATQTFSGGNIFESWTVHGGSVTALNSLNRFGGNGSALTGISPANISAGALPANVAASSIAAGAINSSNQIMDGAVYGQDIADSTITLSKLNQSGCASGEIPKWNGSAWACASDVGGSSYSADEASLHQAGGVFSALASSVTLRGNAFNAANKLLLLDGSGAAPVANGGTGAATAAGARSNLSAAVSGSNNDITALAALTAGGLADGAVYGQDIADSTITLSKLNQSGCALNEIPKWNGTSWACAADGGAAYTADEASLHQAGGVFSALASSVTLQGNVFNAADRLVRLDPGGRLPAADASLLINLAKSQVGLGNVPNLDATDASNISAGTLNDSRLSANVGLLNAGQIFSGVKTFSSTATITAQDASGYSLKLSSGIIATGGTVTAGLFTGNGAGLTGVNASQVAAGNVTAGTFVSGVNLPAAGVLAGTLGTSVVASSIAVGGINNSNQIVDGTILNADLAGSIDDSKLNQIAAAGKVADSALSANVALLNANQAVSGVKTFSSTATITAQDASGYSLKLSSGMLAAGGTITAGLFVGSGGGLTGVQAGGIVDDSITTAKIVDGTLLDADINNGAAIAISKLAASGSLGANVVVSSVAVGAINNSGQIVDGTVLNADLAGSIDDSKLNQIASAGKVADSALSANVGLLNTGQIFSGVKTFSSTVTVTGQDASGYSLKLSSGITATGGTITAGLFMGSGAGLTGVNAAQVAAGNVASGTLGPSVVASSVAVNAVSDMNVSAGANIAKSKISVTGTWAVADIPGLPAGQITSGIFNDSRVAVTTGAVSGVFGDNRVAVTTGAVSGVFGNDKVAISSLVVSGLGLLAEKNTIADADVAVGAAIAQSKISNLTSDLGNRILKTGGTMTGQLTVSGSSITAVNTLGTDSYSLAVTTASDRSVYHLFVSTTGNVGIGTASPGAKLHVVGASKVTGYSDIQLNTSLSAIALILGSADLTKGGIQFQGLDTNTVPSGSTRTISIYGGDTALELGDNNDDVSLSGGRLLVKSATGNVGIGTASPGASLHVAAVSGILSDYGATIGNSGGWSPLMLKTGTAGTKWYVYSSNGGYGAENLVLHYNYTGTPQMLITNTGNVGIGTTSPQTTLELGLNSSGGLALGQGKLYLSQGGDTNHYIQLQPGNLLTYQTIGYHIFQGGNVGIGTNSPGAKLDIQDTSASDSYSLRVGTSATSYHLAVSTSGNVGIGTTSPTRLLTVQDSGYNNWLRLGAGSNNSNEFISIFGGNPGAVSGHTVLDSPAIVVPKFLRIFTNASDESGANGVTAMVLDTNGNVGIGTNNPSGKFEINMSASNYGGVSILGENYSAIDTATRLRIQDTTGAIAWFVSANNDGKFAIHQGGIGDRLSVDNATGNVGIGNTNPGQKLSMEGNISLRSDFANPAIDRQIFVAVSNTAGTSTSGGGGTLWLGTGDNGWGDDKHPPFDGTNVKGAAIALRGFSEAATYRSSIEFFTRNVGGGGNAASRMIIDYAGNVGIGTTSPGYTLTVNGTAWVTSGAWSGSDRRWKKDIAPLNGSLDKIMQLQGVSYNWKTGEFPDLKFSTAPQIGLIAQDVEKIVPEVVTTDKNGYKGISYEKLVPVLIEAAKSQQKRIEELELKVMKLEKKNLNP